MLIKDLMRKMLLPKKEIFLNKWVNIRGVDIYLVSLTLEENRIVLWTMYQVPYCIEESVDENWQENTTRRDEMIRSFSDRLDPQHIHIAEMTIQKQKLTLTSSYANRICDTYYEGYMQMQHFIENGMDIKHWCEVDANNIVIAAYEQVESAEFPIIDLSKELDITLKINKEFKQILVNQQFQAAFGDMGKGNKFFYYDSIEMKKRAFYINSLSHYDIWAEASRNFEDEGLQALPKEQIMQIKEQYMTCLEKTCPKGMDLAILEYETEDGTQLNFYSKEYLDKIPNRKASSASLMFLKSDKELGINGFKSRLCMIKPVEKDFNGVIDIELFSWYMEIPEEIIAVY